MKDQHKRISKTILILVLCLSLIASGLIGAAIAKYISSITGSDSANVALWSIEVNDQQIASAETQTFTFDLFDTIYEEDCETPELHVSEGVIAPGTGGRFAIRVENLSQVDAQFTLTLSESNTEGIPIQYSTDKETWNDDFSEFETLFTDYFLTKETGIAEHTIYWRWCLHGGSNAHDGQTNESDTDLGVLVQEQDVKIAINMAMTVEQYYPKLDPPEASLLSATEITETSVTLRTIEGCEYAVGPNIAVYSRTPELEWQDSPTFTGLTPGTEYIFYARYKGTATAGSSNAISKVISTNKSDVAAPALPSDYAVNAVTTPISVALPVIDGCEYSMDNLTWQDSNEFTELTSGTEYTFFVRYKETEISNVSSASSINITTDSATDFTITASNRSKIGYTAETTDLVIPEVFWDEEDQTWYRVTGISGYFYPGGDAAFPYCTNLTSITIPDSVTTIGNYAIYGSSNLTSINNANSITSIGNQAFYGCTSLTNITLGDSLKTIGNQAFQNCTDLTSITIPNGVTTIGEMAFSGSGLSSIIVPESVEDLGYNSAGTPGAFYNCTGLLSIEAESGNTNFCSTDGVLYSKDMTTLICYPAGKTSASLTIPDSVLYIGKYAAYGATSLTEIIFGEAIEFIETNAFYVGDGDPLDTTIRGGNEVVMSYDWSNDNRLVYWDGESPVIPAGGTYYVGVTSTTVSDYSGATATYTSGDAFPFKPQDGDIYVYGDYEYRYNQKVTRASNDGNTFYRKVANDSTIGGWNPNVIDATKTSYGALLYNINGKPVQTINSTYLLCPNFTSIVIPRSVKNIEAAFHSCASLEIVTIPDSVTTIGGSTFYNCTSLVSITIPDSVTTIGNSAFYNCTNLESVNIPSSVTSIGNSVFQHCTNLTSITIPDSVTTINNSAFINCTGLISIEVDANNANFSSGDGILFNKDKTKLIIYPAGRRNTDYTIPDSVTTIGNSAFYNCNNLTSIIIQDSVTAIEGSAFANCNKLTSVTLPDSVTSIGDYTFYNCSNLTNITIPDNVTSIGNEAFRDCINLESVTIPDSVTTIGGSTFYNCTNLKSITIPSGVTSIGSYAFCHCNGLTDIYFTGTEVEWNSIEFGASWNANCPATIHYNYTAE